MSDRSSKGGTRRRASPPARTRARAPLQQRSQQRVERALLSAERILERLGPEETSIPEIAKDCGIPRASLYQFFPDKYALFAQLAERHLARVAEALRAEAGNLRGLNWQQVTGRLVATASAYYNRTPVASMLVLGGPFSRGSYLSQEVTIEMIGASNRQLLLQLDSPVRFPEKPDVVTLAVEIAFACMKHGYFRDGRISRPMQEQATRAAVAYLSTWLPAGS